MRPRVLEPVQVFIDHPDVVVILVQHVSVVIPRGKATPMLISKVQGGLVALAARAGPGGIGMLFVVPKTSETPDGPVRTAAGKMFEGLRDHLRVVATQIEGTGFAAATKRSIFTWATSNMLGKTPIKTFGGLAEATVWLAAQCAAQNVACPPAAVLHEIALKHHQPMA